MPALDFCRTVGPAAACARSLYVPISIERGAASDGEYCLRGYLWEENVNTYLQGRKITAAHSYERPSVEVLHLIRKLRRIGMEEEAEGLKRNYMKPRWLAVSSRPRKKPTRSTVLKSALILGRASSQW
jgi:hypothetical protein